MCLQALLIQPLDSDLTFPSMKNLGEKSTQQEIIRRLARIKPESRRRWGKMSAAQMICHLSDSFRRALGERQVSALPPNKLLKFLALYVPIRWPHGVRTRPEMDQEIGGTRPVEFENDMQQLLRLFDRFTSQPPDYQWSSHPMFGTMSRSDTVRWAYLHMDHHLRQFGA